MSIENFTVSIILNIYNAEKYIVEFLDSLNILENQDFELVIVDDGSTDSTLDLIIPYFSKYKIRLEKMTHLGLVPARAHGFEVASGDILIVLDVDEVINDTSLLQKFIEPFTDPKVGAVGGNILPLGTGWLVEAQRLDRQLRQKIRKNKYRREAKYVMGGVSAFRNQAIRNIGGMSRDPNIVEDTDISIRLRDHGWRLIVRDDILVGHPDPNTLGDIYKKAVRQGGRIVNIFFKHPNEVLSPQFLLVYFPAAVLITSIIDWRIGICLISLSFIVVLLFLYGSRSPIHIRILSWILLWVNGIGVAIGTIIGLIDMLNREKNYSKTSTK